MPRFRAWVYIRLALLLSALVPVSLASVHRLLAASFNGNFVAGLEFDSDAGTLAVISNTTTAAPHGWFALDANKTTVYGAAWSSPGTLDAYTLDKSTYALDLVSTLSFGSSRPLHIVAPSNGNAAGSIYAVTNTMGMVVTSTSASSPFAAVQTFNLSSASFGHGIAISPSGELAYVADIDGEQIWAYNVQSNGTLASIGQFATHNNTDGPRHLTFSTDGNTLYVVEQNSCRVDSYAVSGNGTLAWTSGSSIIPSGLECSTSVFWSDEVAISSDSSILYASTRGRTSSTNGYVAGFSLSSNGTIGELQFIFNMTSSGGAAAAIIAAPASIDSSETFYSSLSDSEVGYIAIMKYRNGSFSEVARTSVYSASVAQWVD
ncbi:putative isomerase YbhE [Ceratobasidium sp. AG-I]|nr:putative isomerase YbhE [Ceratobasidium sp. AG-I]